jgi:uncharacterized protein
MNRLSITATLTILGIVLGLTAGGCETGTSRGKLVKLKKDYPIEAVPLTDVSLTDNFWKPKIEINRTVTIPHILNMCEKSKRIDNFAVAGGLKQGEFCGQYPFDDSDVYKSIEAASYSLSAYPDPNLEKYLDEIIAKIAAAQEKDGYLYTARTTNTKRLESWFGKERWSKEEGSHELYNAGHLYEAAVAHYLATGKHNLLDIAIKNADLLDNTFGPNKLHKWPGHQEVEIGLVKLYRATGNEKYLNLAKFFLDVRGPRSGEYNQAHKKPVDQNEAVGHAVRAMYMYNGMTDIAAMTGDERYTNATALLWDNVVGKKMYITGGLGAKSDGEAFGKNYELPNATSYCETCAAIGSAMWNYRMFRLTGDAKYLDIFERTVYNGLISGVSLSGDRFFYVNPLESNGQHRREPWFGCACCPPNIARFMASLPGYVFAKTDDTIYVNMFAACDGTIQLKNNTVRIKQQTLYPWDGAVKLTVEPANTGNFAVAVRIPCWAQGKPVPSDLYTYADSNVTPIEFKLNGQVIKPDIKNGFAFIDCQWQKSETIEMTLPMPARYVVANTNVAADKDRIAVEKGPLVYCAEGIGNDVNVLTLALVDKVPLWCDMIKDLLGGTIIVHAKGLSPDGKLQDITMTPYYTWANRGPTTMAVWLKDGNPEYKALQESPKIEINTAKTKEPISKYIYGQFIEHLGRCIYGGIWAEMLEDRKFFFPITDDYKPWGTDKDPQWNAGEYKYLKASPWKVIGPAGTVTMDTNNPYVGRHTPVITMPGDSNEAGISQEGLVIVKNKGYTGRIILAGDKFAGHVIVRFVPDKGDTISIDVSRITPEFKTYLFAFTASESSDNVCIEIVGKGKGVFRIGTLSLMPADNIKGWRSDVVTLLKELDSPIYRWPGGNFVSGYDWKDGIGERDKRPPRKNPAWKGIEHDDVGIHEFMELMEIIGAEPYVALNTGKGTIEEAIAEVEYCNGSIDTPMGKLRAENGRPEPYKVKWWAVGNEMYGNWQIGHIPLEEYVKKHNKIAEAIWKIDAGAKLVGVGNVGKWSEMMLRICSSHMNLLSEHIYCKEIKSDVTRHTKQLANEIKRVADAHRKYRRDINEISGKDIRIAMDEWNYWYGNYIYGELGTQYFLKDALGVATGLHEYFRNSDIYYMANYAQTVNVIGAIKTSRTASSLDTTGVTLKLYRQRFGQIPVDVKCENVVPLDIAAALKTDLKTITIGIVNPTDTPRQLSLGFNGIKVRDKGKLWVIAGTDPLARNVPGKEAMVTIEEKSVDNSSKKLNSPALSICIYEFAAE